MFRFKNLKKKQPKSASVSKEIEDLEKFVMTAMKIDAVVLDAFDRRAQLRLNDFEERLGHLEARMAGIETFFDYPSPSEFTYPSSCDLGAAAAPERDGAAAAPERDEGQVTFEASVAPQRPPKWSQASIEAFLAAQAKARGEPKEEWMRLAIGCTPASSDSLSGVAGAVALPVGTRRRHRAGEEAEQATRDRQEEEEQEDEEEEERDEDTDDSKWQWN